MQPIVLTPEKLTATAKRLHAELESTRGRLGYNQVLQMLSQAAYAMPYEAVLATVVESKDQDIDDTALPLISGHYSEFSVGKPNFNAINVLEPSSYATRDSQKLSRVNRLQNASGEVNYQSFDFLKHVFIDAQGSPYIPGPLSNEVRQDLEKRHEAIADMGGVIILHYAKQRVLMVGGELICALIPDYVHYSDSTLKEILHPELEVLAHRYASASATRVKHLELPLTFENPQPDPLDIVALARDTYLR
jgi:hypothetical protein